MIQYLGTLRVGGVAVDVDSIIKSLLLTDCRVILSSSATFFGAEHLPQHRERPKSAGLRPSKYLVLPTEACMWGLDARDATDRSLLLNVCGQLWQSKLTENSSENNMVSSVS